MVRGIALPSLVLLWAFYVLSLDMEPTWRHVDTPVTLRVHDRSPPRIAFAFLLGGPPC